MRRSRHTAKGVARCRSCARCHGRGRFGSPGLGRDSDWQPRLEQGVDALVAHALSGHGDMPAKGGYRHLGDDEVAAAVAYLVDRARDGLAAPGTVPAACRRDLRAAECPPEQRRTITILRLLWMLGRPS